MGATAILLERSDGVDHSEPAELSRFGPPLWICRARFFVVGSPGGGLGKIPWAKTEFPPPTRPPATTALRLIPCTGRLSVMIRHLLSLVWSGNTVSEPRPVD